VCYVLGPLRLGIPALAAYGNRDAGVLAYVTVLQAYGGIAVFDVLRICWIHRNTARRFLRIGLRHTAVGCACVLLYSLHKIAYFSATAIGVSLPWAENGTTGIQLLFLAPAVVCNSVGITVPFLGPRISAWWTRRAEYQDLGVLASALSAAD